MTGSAGRARIFGECDQCGRRFNYVAPAGKTSWSGKCTGCGMPVTATVAGVPPEPEPVSKTKKIPKATYRAKTTKEPDDAPKGTQDSTESADGGAGGTPPVPAAGEPADATNTPTDDVGQPAGDGSGGRDQSQDEPAEGKARRRNRERELVRERRGSYDHLGYPY